MDTGGTGDAPRLSGWQHAWRVAAVGVASVPFWLITGTLLPEGAERGWFLVGDPLVGLVCLALVLWRRGFPLVVAVLTSIGTGASMLAGGASLLALCSLATRRKPWEMVAAGVVYVVASQFNVRVYPLGVDLYPVWLLLALPALIAGTSLAIGVAIGARRAELRSLRERVAGAEREQSARAAQVRATERNRIAREMHDVLAHRISLVAMQAGVLGHRADLRAEDVAELARGIAEGSRQALEELRDVLGVLRASPDGDLGPALGPSLERVPELVADARSSGLDVGFGSAVAGQPPEGVGRACYRIVQEGLTNAAKHAPGSRVEVEVRGGAGAGLRVRVGSSRGPVAGVGAPPSGYGLLGLAERIALLGGEFEHGPTPDGGYALAARLPWRDGGRV
ncbi:sensor histidine kinase [Actinosynnema mirum]|uniref:histidine kinase n=1 Tax=Actinosynnema mirum (strain ATCC 29888 / DSM 43827 / JCM 3225 / NBRC 14064 / NCIMB 13271 / NRRL B-12336 / IMRU 3971 / 101) TaxID=446462 RepID=C6W8X2_ACTMD|nr:histidine kinase [Actinosynnema mirum]ACU37221.1 histidine kinase [Actinosynnema mirum DSM 43827]